MGSLVSLPPPFLPPLPPSPLPPTSPQLAVIPENDIFLGLADNEIFYADLSHFAILGHVVRSRGASFFAVDWQKLRPEKAGYGRHLRLCVATRRKLQLYEWRKSTFCPIKVRVCVEGGL